MKPRKEVIDYSEYYKYLMPERSCPLCQKLDNRNDWAIYDDVLKAVQCLNCDLVFMERILSDLGLKKYYEDYIVYRLGHKKKWDQRKVMYEIDKSYLLRHVSQGKLLDVGCSSGEFLKVLSSSFDCTGIDVDRKAVDLAKNEGSEISDKVILMSLEEAVDELGKFDVITLRGVIEHLSNPSETFEIADEMLKKGGILFICATPNVESPCAEIYREKWNQFDPLQHITHFSSQTVNKMLECFSIKLEAEYYPYLDTPYASPKDDIENVMEAVSKVMNGVNPSELPRSPAFWGNMITLVFRKL